MSKVIKNEMDKAQTDKDKRKKPNTDDIVENADSLESDYILSALPADVVESLDKDTIKEIQRIESTIKGHIHEHAIDRNINEEGIRDLFDNDTCDDNVDGEEPTSNAERLTQRMDTESEQEGTTIFNENNISDETQGSGITENEQSAVEFHLTEDDYSIMLQKLLESKDSHRWQSSTTDSLRKLFELDNTMDKSFNKRELQLCLRSVSARLKQNKIAHALSWPKYKIIKFFSDLVHFRKIPTHVSNRSHRHTVKSLKRMCQNVVSSIPKVALNAIYAEHIFPDRLEAWKQDNPFLDGSQVIDVIDSINWYCKPEYIQSTYIHQFAFLDPHHIFTNARVKCCNTGIAERGITKDAWIKVAKDGQAGLNLALVEDLVDRQSDAFAVATFSEEVEQEMLVNGFINEANLCHLLREWYNAEDNPGISAIERCNSRLNMRRWLLNGVQFNKFPPPGSHILGIPQIMFEGLMTNIDRRIQLFSYVKKGNYNVRALGSLEAENLFGAFQDRSGVIRPDDIPAALNTACEILTARMDSTKPFHIHTSRAKVYPLHTLMESDISIDGSVFLTPNVVDTVKPKDHEFDMSERTDRKQRKRKSGKISTYNAPAKGCRTVRQHHHCDEEKIFADIRANKPLE